MSTPPHAFFTFCGLTADTADPEEVLAVPQSPSPGAELHPLFGLAPIYPSIDTGGAEPEPVVAGSGSQPHVAEPVVNAIHLSRRIRMSGYYCMEGCGPGQMTVLYCDEYGQPHHWVGSFTGCAYIVLMPGLFNGPGRRSPWLKVLTLCVL